MNPSLAFVIAHYHPEGRVNTDLRALVRSLSELTRRIVFVSTGISDEAAAQLRPFAQVIARENFGYDFWSYKVGIEALGSLSDIDRLVIFNSSFVTLSRRKLCTPFLGPVREPCLNGLTRCDFGQPHLQSFWVAFEGRELLRSSAFARWWSAMTPVSERLEVIRRYEMGMSAHFLAAGVPMKAAFRPTQEEEIVGMCRMIASRRGRQSRFVEIPEDGPDRRPRLRIELASRLNPTHILWEVLLQRHGILKLDLLKNNHFDIGMRALERLCEARPDVRALLDEAMGR